jgi:hypothetical protein
VVSSTMRRKSVDVAARVCSSGGVPDNVILAGRDEVR